MNDSFVQWLLLAGPLWAAIGLYFLPRMSPKRKRDAAISESDLQAAGVVGGFALGPLGIGLFYWEPRLIRRITLAAGITIAVFISSQVLVRVNDPNLPSALWLILAGPLWAGIASYFIPRRYREVEAIDTNALTAAALGGFAIGPLIIGLMWKRTPRISREWMIALGSLGAWQIYTLFALHNVSNPCVAAPYHITYLTQQTANGVVIGSIYSLMAVGLTLIYSVQGVVSFAHGQLYMVGGYFSFYFLQYAGEFLSNLTNSNISVNPIWGIPVAAIIVFVMGAIFERIFLKPMHEGLIERVSEYAILITFGFGFFLEYTTLAIAGPFPQRTDRFIEIRRFTLDRIHFSDEFFFGPIHIIGDRAFAMFVGIALIFALLYFLQRSWTGRALRATSQDRQAAAVTGINPTNMNTLSFAMGSMLAAMSGAALIPIFNWVPWVGAEMVGRSYVIVVLGGLGSVPGALVGGVIVGIVEALGAGCHPDPSRGAAYKEAFPLVIFALVLLLKPTGLFGREQH
ncbi:MAG: branched-chain amino acid ABC transporter permease [Chloroflexota bacterium]|nr:branched-chain amino acid ABC transporter permease [Chloroflexota bacterium]